MKILVLNNDKPAYTECLFQVVPARGMASVNFSFTPFPTEEVVKDMDCEGYALGYMSLDKVNPNTVKPH